MKNGNKVNSIEQLLTLLTSYRDATSSGNMDDEGLREEVSHGDFKNLKVLEDKEGNKFVLIPNDILKSAVDIIQNEYNMRMDAEITRDIILHAPIDFDDVLSVVSNRIDKLRDNGKDPSKINILSLVSDIKKTYPHLFRHSHMS